MLIKTCMREQGYAILSGYKTNEVGSVNYTANLKG